MGLLKISKLTHWKTLHMNKLLIFYLFLAFEHFIPKQLQANAYSGQSSEVSFLENKGQWVDDILFQGTSLSMNVCLLKNGLSFSQRGERDKVSSNQPVLVWNMKFGNCNLNHSIEGVKGKKSVYSYLSGNNPEDWVIHPMEYQRINYNQIYPGIDLQFYGKGSYLEYDYILQPGSSVKSIETYYEGIKSLRISGNGDLEVSTLWNVQLQKAPVAWQYIEGVKHDVAIQYVILNDSTFGFQLPAGYNQEFDLIIDPLFQMVWSSYTNITGSSNNINYCFSNAMDIDGNVYLTGMVDASFPITPGAYSGPGNVQPEIFIAKFSSDGTTLIYWTYLPGNSSEFGVAIAVDSLGRAYVTGVVDLNSTGITNFPSTPNAYQPAHNTGSDAFITVLNPAGSGLVYSSFLGGTGSETGYDIALGPDGIAYITGNTSLGNFPVKASSVFPTGDRDVFVAKFDINQSGNNSLVYSVRIGGGSFIYCYGRSIAVNNAGNVFITGNIGTSFGSPQYPTTPGAYSSVYNTGQDGGMSFVTKLSATTPVTLSYSTFLAPGIANGIAVDLLTDEAFITGSTETFAFPVTPGVLQPVHAGAGGTDAFAIKLNATGSGLIYSTFIGGPNWDNGTSIAVNNSGEAYVTGLAEINFPTSTGSFQPNFAGGWKDFFVVHLNSTGTNYGCGGSTFVGGSDADYTGSFYDFPAPQISLRDHGGSNDTVSISATTHSQDFPTTPGVFGPVKVNGIADQPVFFKMTCATSVVAPLAGFTTNVTTTCGSASINLVDISTNNPVSWQWYFPGGIPSVSNIQNPQGIIYTSSGTYSIKLVTCNSAGCDSTEISVQIVIPQNIPVNLGNDTTVCNSTVILGVVPGSSTYSWQLNGMSIGINSSTYLATQSGTYTVFVTDTNGCTGTDTVLVSISNPVVSIGPDLLLCNNDSVSITATSGFTSYQWLFNGNIIPGGNNSIALSQQGIYMVVVVDSLGCETADTLEVIQDVLAVALINDTSFCSGSSFIINAGAGFSTYQWLLNGAVISTQDTILINESGTYQVIVSNAAGCSADDSVNIVVFDSPDVQTGGNQIVCSGSSVFLAATGAVNYSWSPATFLSSPFSPATVCLPLSSITYIVTGTNLYGCIDTTEVFVEVLNLPSAAFSYTTDFGCNGIEFVTANESQDATGYFWDFGDGTTSTESSPVHYFSTLQNQTIFMVAYNGICSDTMSIDYINYQAPDIKLLPNVFTPNGDGKNDCFSIPGSENLNDCFELSIFNRWGNLVYKSDENTACWDGKSTGNTLLPEGVYLYVVSYLDEIINGTVQLIRD